MVFVHWMVHRRKSSAYTAYVMARCFLVVGGGGKKIKVVRTLQEDTKLMETNFFMRDLSKQITERIKDCTIKYTNDFKDFEGDLEFNDNDYEQE